MSIAITELGLGAPPARIERLGNRNVTVWRCVCDCGYPSKTFPLIGLALEQMRVHAEHHRLRTFESWVEAEDAA